MDQKSRSATAIRTNDASPTSTSTTQWRACAGFVIWMALIFWTSCYVVRPRELFGMIEQVTGANPESMHRFELFWGVSWFAIVKGWHFSEFAILTMLTAGAIRWLRGSLGTWSIVAAMLFCTAFAISDEWHQSFVPDRVGSLEDVLIDCLGIGAAGAILIMRSNANDTPQSLCEPNRNALD